MGGQSCEYSYGSMLSLIPEAVFGSGTPQPRNRSHFARLEISALSSIVIRIFFSLATRLEKLARVHFQHFLSGVLLFRAPHPGGGLSKLGLSPGDSRSSFHACRTYLETSPS